MTTRKDTYILPPLVHIPEQSKFEADPSSPYIEKLIIPPDEFCVVTPQAIKVFAHQELGVPASSLTLTVNAAFSSLASLAYGGHIPRKGDYSPRQIANDVFYAGPRSSAPNRAPVFNSGLALTPQLFVELLRQASKTAPTIKHLGRSTIAMAVMTNYAQAINIHGRS